MFFLPKSGMHLSSPQTHANAPPISFRVDVITQIIFGEDSGKVVTVHAMNAYRGSRGVAPLVLTLGTRYRCVVNFTPR
jgi:hypothetical protein